MAFNPYHRKLNSEQVRPTVTLSTDWCLELWTRARESALALHIGLSQLVARALYQYLEDNNLPENSFGYTAKYYSEGIKAFNQDPNRDPDSPPAV